MLKKFYKTLNNNRAVQERNEDQKVIFKIYFEEQLSLVSTVVVSSMI